MCLRSKSRWLTSVSNTLRDAIWLECCGICSWPSFLFWNEIYFDIVLFVYGAIRVTMKKTQFSSNTYFSLLDRLAEQLYNFIIPILNSVNMHSFFKSIDENVWMKLFWINGHKNVASGKSYSGWIRNFDTNKYCLGMLEYYLVFRFFRDNFPVVELKGFSS